MKNNWDADELSTYWSLSFDDLDDYLSPHPVIS